MARVHGEFMFAPDAYVPVKSNVPYKNEVTLFTGNLEAIIYLLNIIIFYSTVKLVDLSQQHFV